MVTDRSLAERAPGKVTQPGLPGAFDTRTNDCNPSVVPGAQLMVTDEHAGAAARATSPNSGGVVVEVGGGVVVVVVGAGVSLSVVLASKVWSSTPS